MVLAAGRLLGVTRLCGAASLAAVLMYSAGRPLQHFGWRILVVIVWVAQ
jgi:hypothetical protein